MEKTKNTFERLLVLTDLGTVRVLGFKEAGGSSESQAHLVEIAKGDLGPPIGAITTDDPGKFSRGFAAGEGEAMSHAETKLDIEIEKRSIAQVAEEIQQAVSAPTCKSFVLAAPQEYLKRLEAELDDDCRAKLGETVGVCVTKSTLKDLEKRFL